MCKCTPQDTNCTPDRARVNFRTEEGARTLQTTDGRTTTYNEHEREFAKTTDMEDNGNS